ncbi:MAG TPA: hypothetical protein VIL00_00970 [Pseudonocardiaceae bacterium]
MHPENTTQDDESVTDRGSVGLTEDERAELAWLRSENALLRVQRDVLLRIASGYARDMDAMLRQHTWEHDNRPR